MNKRLYTITIFVLILFIIGCTPKVSTTGSVVQQGLSEHELKEQSFGTTPSEPVKEVIKEKNPAQIATKTSIAKPIATLPTPQKTTLQNKQTPQNSLYSDLKTCKKDDDCVRVKTINGLDHIPTSEETCGTTCYTAINGKYLSLWEHENWKHLGNPVCNPLKCEEIPRTVKPSCIGNICSPK